MAVITGQKIVTLYEKYKTIDVVFIKDVINVTGLVTNQVFIKCVSDNWPCVIYSSSFQGARIVVNTKTGIMKKLQQANNMASLRFCFKNPDSPNPVTFFVTGKSMGSVPYGDSEDSILITLQFTQRPPDDLIETMGRILDANFNSKKRKEERILMTPDSLRRLSLQSKECVVFIQKVPRRCILRDISFSDAKVIMVGVEKFLVDKEVGLRMDFDDPKESFILRGKFTHAKPVEGRKDLVVLTLSMDESVIPMGYKVRVNEFISQVRADTRGTEEVVEKKAAEAKNPEKVEAETKVLAGAVAKTVEEPPV